MNAEQYKYKTELHLHTSPASRCSEISPQLAVELYAGLGYHSIVVCNHFFAGMPFRDSKRKCIDTYLADYNLALEAEKKYGINVILGCEMRFTENANDYLLFGIDREFLDFVYECFDMGIEEFSKQFRNEERLLIQAHPFRDGMTKVAPEYLDGMETFNMHPNHNSRVALASKYAKMHNLIPTAGTDFHHLGHEGMAALLTKRELKTSHDIVEVLKSRDYIFEIGGCALFCFPSSGSTTRQHQSVT